MPDSMTPEEIYDSVRAVLTESIDEVDPEKIAIRSHLANDLGAASTDFIDTYLRLARKFPRLRESVRPFSEKHAATYTVESICSMIAQLYDIPWDAPAECATT